MFQQFKTKGGVSIDLSEEMLTYRDAIEPIAQRLDTERGAVFASGFEFPGRYACWDLGFCNPPLVLICTGITIQVQALNARGEQLLGMLMPCLQEQAELAIELLNPKCCAITVIPSNQLFSEEERSHQPSVFSVLRAILTWFKLDEEPYLGLYGAFGYDLIFQFEAIERLQCRAALQRDLVLYLPDEILIVNHRKETASLRRYDFQYENWSTHGLPREGVNVAYEASERPEITCDHPPKAYEALVEKAKTKFQCGDLFEVVPSQTFYTFCEDSPSQIFKRMRVKNPSPYGFLINLGEGEFLIGASPEMYVRVQGRRVETAPISGTIRRGEDAIEDAINIQMLLDSDKEKSELTMCTDVDRNDKSRICEAGSVQVIGRRQIEIYSRLIHTVDHVEGQLRDGFDAIDAFLTHMWVVTVTGAPKLWAMKFIEAHEKSPRKWYGGAVGWLTFDGNMNTGLVLRTVRLQRGLAEVRVGATLLYDSVPQDEEAETRLKASAFLEILKRPGAVQPSHHEFPQHGMGKKVLLIDHQDSFVHTLANYIRQTGAEVETIRFDHAEEFLHNKMITAHSNSTSRGFSAGSRTLGNSMDPADKPRDVGRMGAKEQFPKIYDLVVLSPGPGKPADFHLNQTIERILNLKIPLFGVCLGLQGIVEYFGGILDVLNYPMHGKSSLVHVHEKTDLLKDFEDTFLAARYHSLHARLSAMPKTLKVTATSEDGIVMAIAHQNLPIQAVQFHPEAILSLPKQAGIRLINNLMAWVDSHG